LQLAHAIVQDGQAELAALGAWRRYSEAALSDSIQMLNKQHYQTDGPFRADQLRCGDPYELDDGHPIECLPSGGRHAQANLNGGVALDTDPAVESAGFDAGFTPDEKNLRAPDIAVGNIPDEPGWVPGAPPLAVEYADTGQNEGDLQAKIRTLLGAGTRYVWVVRLTGPRRVEVHTPDGLQLAYPGEELKAPGILRNPVRVEALYDPDASREAALRNLLQRRGYADLEAVQEKSRQEGRQEGYKEGLHSGQSALVLRQLKRVTGPIQEEDSQRIGQLGPDGLDALAEALLDFREKSDLTAWLERH